MRGAFRARKGGELVNSGGFEAGKGGELVNSGGPGPGRPVNW